MTTITITDDEAMLAEAKGSALWLRLNANVENFFSEKTEKDVRECADVIDRLLERIATLEADRAKQAGQDFPCCFDIPGSGQSEPCRICHKRRARAVDEGVLKRVARAIENSLDLNGHRNDAALWAARAALAAMKGEEK